MKNRNYNRFSSQPTSMSSSLLLVHALVRLSSTGMMAICRIFVSEVSASIAAFLHWTMYKKEAKVALAQTS